MSRTVSRLRAAELLAEWTKTCVTHDALWRLERHGVLPIQPPGRPRYSAATLVRARLALLLRDYDLRPKMNSEVASLLMERAKRRGDTTLELKRPGGMTLTITVPLAQFQREAEEAIDSLVTT